MGPATTPIVIGSGDGATNADAAWFYPTPKPAAANITDRVAFWKGVQVEDWKR